MGAAISMLADPEWEHILLESVAKGGFLGEGAAAKVWDEGGGGRVPIGGSSQSPGLTFASGTHSIRLAPLDLPAHRWFDVTVDTMPPLSKSGD